MGKIFQIFIFCLFLIWTVLFGLVFYLAFPDATDAIILHHQLRMNMPIPPPQELPQPQPQQQVPKPAVVVPQQQEEEFVPITKNSPQIELKTKNKEGVPTEQEMDQKLGTALENRLIRILVKINLAACKACSKDDKRIILQLKMMKAFLDGQPKLAQRYSEELDNYLKTKRGKWVTDDDDD